jgi:hypothetical protein
VGHVFVKDSIRNIEGGVNNGSEYLQLDIYIEEKFRVGMGDRYI